ncbi:MAG: hypothetical protein A3F12_01760 [Gammaproteobacteria bacterium RIFCSPHIGHO2_12_FULL_38_14]|nr:MAG: hypothetical protein A3F12_01760 [Gammaproteobacteria bacterium RIFCSPHIGHO2_12_FULL_38_14]
MRKLSKFIKWAIWGTPQNTPPQEQDAGAIVAVEELSTRKRALTALAPVLAAFMTGGEVASVLQRYAQGYKESYGTKKNGSLDSVLYLVPECLIVPCIALMCLALTCGGASAVDACAFLCLAALAMLAFAISASGAWMSGVQAERALARVLHGIEVNAANRTLTNQEGAAKYSIIVAEHLLPVLTVIATVFAAKNLYDAYRRSHIHHDQDDTASLAEGNNNVTAYTSL